MVTFLVAGHETTSGTLSFLFYNLLKYPETLQKAQQEVDQVLGVCFLPVSHVLPLLLLPSRKMVRREGHTLLLEGYPSLGILTSELSLGCACRCQAPCAIQICRCMYQRNVTYNRSHWCHQPPREARYHPCWSIQHFQGCPHNA